MPKQKDLKRLTRVRMQKTGEAYTTARAQLLRKKANLLGKKAEQKTLAELPVGSSDLAELAGTSDETVRQKTGKTWRQWLQLLDAAGAVSMSHRDIARWIRTEYEISHWWSQMVTVGYERIRGLRDKGQRRDGKYDANKSKTFPVPVSELYRALRSAARRRQWLPEVDLEISTARKDKSVRMKMADGTRVQAYFVAKSAAKSQLAIQHTGLKDASEVTRSKEEWGARLTALARYLKS